MAKKFGKFLAFITIASAACAGVYYFLTKDEEECECCKTSKKEDIENFFSKKDSAESEREYVPLKPQSSPEDAKDNEALKNVVTKAAEELKEKAAEEADGVGLVKDSTEASEFAFKEFKDAVDELENK